MGDFNNIWAPYEPDAKAPWGLRRVVHLHRRAGVVEGVVLAEAALVHGPAGQRPRRLLHVGLGVVADAQCE